MRVIAGRYKGRNLLAPRGRGTRPILDRVKAALFDVLGVRLAQPGALPPADVLDLFAGSGSLGIEALSRGAASCVFVETDRAALGCLRRNLASLGIGPTARVFMDPVEVARAAPPPPHGFDLIFLDPPYALSEDMSPRSLMQRAVARLGTTIPAGPDALLVWRHAESCRLPDSFPSGWASCERRTWGTMAISFFQRSQEGHP
ncbi:MAG: 16S rRNA (guanine(966)-N(2))-methyltransferase RsmD [Planctomycetota bacterium]